MHLAVDHGQLTNLLNPAKSNQIQPKKIRLPKIGGQKEPFPVKNPKFLPVKPSQSQSNQKTVKPQLGSGQKAAIRRQPPDN
jgi:hypothetical protein